MQLLNDVGGSGTRPTPVILNASPAGVQIQSSSTPVMMQSSAGGQSPSVGGSSRTGGVLIMPAGSAVGSPSAAPPQPAAAASVSPAGIVIRSTTGASPPQPSYNGPAIGQAPPSVVQPQPVGITPSPVPQVGGVSPVTMASGVIRVGPPAASPQAYGPSQPASVMVNQPTAVAARPATSVQQTPASARSQGAAAAVPTTAGKPRLTPGELVSKADPLWVCGFILAVVAVAFATMAFEDEISTTWLLLFVSAASVGAFVKLQLWEFSARLFRFFFCHAPSRSSTRTQCVMMIDATWHRSGFYMCVWVWVVSRFCYWLVAYLELQITLEEAPLKRKATLAPKTACGVEDDNPHNQKTCKNISRLMGPVNVFLSAHTNL